MKSTIVVFTISLILVASCNQESKEIHGTYKFVDYNLIEQVWLQLNNSWYSVGRHLELKEDSTFTYGNCSTLMTGTWIVEADSLLLNVVNARWKIDSLQRFGYKGRWPSVPEKPYKYHFEGDKLLRKLNTVRKGKDKTYVLQMKKVNSL